MNIFMNQISGFFGAYWGMVIVVVAFAIYAVFQRGQAKQIILSLMLQVEKEAETLALATGEAKFSFVVDKGWDLLPPWAKVFLTKALFIELAQKLYDEAKKYFTSSHETPADKKPDPAPVTNVVLPSDPSPVNPVPITPAATKTLPTEDSPADMQSK